MKRLNGAIRWRGTRTPNDKEIGSRGHSPERLASTSCGLARRLLGAIGELDAGPIAKSSWAAVGLDQGPEQGLDQGHGGR